MKIEKDFKPKIQYYEDELNDEFSGTKIESRIIDENFKYRKSPVWDFCSLIVQNILSFPIKFFYLKLKFNHQFIGKEKYKQTKKQGIFIYSNHTQNFSDTFTTSQSIYPKRNFLLVNPENISLKGTGWLVELLGAIPLPSNLKATKNFLDEIERKMKQKRAITIYPEAHIWPYYTKIRNFKSVSFKYPVKLNAPIYTVTNTYQKYKGNKIKMVSYIDGPFYPDQTISPKEAQEKLRNQAYETMCKRAQNSNFEYIRYCKKVENK